MNHRFIAYLIGLVVILAIVGGGLYWQWPEIPADRGRTAAPSGEAATTSLLELLPQPAVGPPPAEAAPPIAWTPTSINEVVGQGQTKTVTASFTSSQKLTNVVVRVVPELQPFVQVSPASFSSIAKGQTATVNITFSASATAQLGTATGTIQLRSGSGAPKTFARPLPVELEVWNRVSDATYSFAFSYPPFPGVTEHVVEPFSDETLTIDLNVFSQSQRRFVSQFGFTVNRNDDGLTLLEWFERKVDPDGVLIAQGSFVERILSNGMNALALAGPIPDEYGGGPVASFYAISTSGRSVVSLAPAQEHDLVFYGYDRDAQRSLLQKVLESAEFP